MIKKGIQWLTDRMAQRFGHAARHLTARTGEQVNVTGLMLDILTQRERQNELPWLTPQRAVELYEAWRRGELADVQRVWEQLEETDDTLMTVLDKRQRALADMPWAILTDAEAIGDDAERARKAELQQAYLQTVFNAVENLEEALVHLGMADFRGVAALEITGNMQRMRWEVIEPWCLARPVRRGPWMYNAKADVTFSTLEEMEKERIIVREARPIDLACMFLIVDKMHAVHGWDAFLDVYGNPSIFLERPPATGEQMAKVYDALAKRIIGDGRGTVPAGSKFHTVETRQNNCDSFEKRARWCADAIITVATGGLLTVTAESGSGTLAGSAHADSFENLVAGSAASISATINRQFTRRLLAAAFPDDPPLAYFSLAPEPADERMQLAQLLATLKTAGWQTTQEKASELMQMDVEPVPAAPSSAPMMNTAPEPAAPVVNRTEEPQVEEPPLTDEELAAFAALRHPNPERIAQHLASVEAKLRGAADLPEDGGEVKNKKGMYSETCRAKDKARCSTHGYTERYKAATGAVRQVMATKQDFQAAVEVPGLGEIDFPYGRPGTHEKNEKGATHEDGYGLSHIEDKHGTRALHRMPYVLAHGKVEPHPDASKRVIRHGSEIAVVREGQQGRWELVTSYDENKNSHRDDLGISSTTEEERKARK